MADIGEWNCDVEGLPCFKYTGALPYKAFLKSGKSVKLSDNPWFLLGNYQLTLFTHVDGEYELITGQRAWGRVNQGEKRNSGANRAVVQIEGENHELTEVQLTGPASPLVNPKESERIFGCGFADYSYKIEGVKIRRNLSVKPSTTPHNGSSAFLLTVVFCNEGNFDKKIKYLEGVTANYQTMQYQMNSKESLKVQYENVLVGDEKNNCVKILIKGKSADPLLVQNENEISRYEQFPPALYIQRISEKIDLSEQDDELLAEAEFILKKGETKSIQLIIGFSFDDEITSIERNSADLLDGISDLNLNEKGSVYAKNWVHQLPSFPNEPNSELKNELVWHAYNLEAMATYSNFYKETKIPQGTIYDYDWGVHASARDNFQHALPLVYYNQPLAKSVLFYMLERTTSFGEIRLIEMGNGYADNERYFTSDQQLFFFLYLSEYLRVTKDYQILSEKIKPYPVENQQQISVLEMVKACFVFLRDTIGTGEHGIVRLMNSDWNDTIFYIEKVPYNNVFFTGESHMNSAMVLSIFQNLIPELQNAQKVIQNSEDEELISNIAKSMDFYRSVIKDAFLKDLGNRKFPRRMYFNSKSYGDENMFLEPQGYALQINEFSDDYKRTLYEEMKKRVYDGEKLGAREQQNPEFESPDYDKGSRENGGFWWALNGPVILGVSTFDKKEAERLLSNMTFINFRKQFPEYWTSYWSAADNVESSLIEEEGLPDQSSTYSNIPVYCAHPHAWILYCYLYLKNLK